MVRSEVLRTSLDAVVYLGMSMYLVSRAVQKLAWLQRDELGTIYKVSCHLESYILLQSPLGQYCCCSYCPAGQCYSPN